MKLINCFIVAAESNSFSQAAKRLFITSPGVIKQIRSLEEQVGFQLFIRNNKGIRLTEAGGVFYNEAKKIISLYKESIILGKRVATCCYETLRIGVWGGTRGALIPRACRVFSQNYPDVTLEYVTTDGVDPAEMLRKNIIDVELSYGFSGRKSIDLDIITLCCEMPKCLVPRQSILAQLAEITFASLRKRCFVLPSPGRSAYHDVLREYIIMNEPEINIVSVTGHDSGLTQMLVMNAPAVVPPLFAEDNDSFILLPFEWKKEISVELISRKEDNLLVKHFLDATIVAIQELESL